MAKALKLYTVTAKQWEYDMVVSAAVYATDEQDAEALFRGIKYAAAGPYDVELVERKRGVVHEHFNAG